MTTPDDAMDWHDLLLFLGFVLGLPGAVLIVGVLAVMRWLL